MSMGAYVDPLFNMYASRIKEKPHPSTGFFLMEPDLTTGMLGSGFSMYVACKNSESVVRTHALLMMTKDAEMDELGQVRSKVFLPFGQGERYKRFLSSMSYSQSFINSVFEENPFSFVDMPKDRRELEARIMDKCSDPSIVDAFDFQTDSKLHASSVFILSAPCLVVKTKDWQSRIHSKVSMTQYCKELGVYEGEISYEMMSVMFPMIDFYEEFRRAIENLKIEMKGKRLLKPTSRTRTKMMTISVPKCTASMPISLMTALRRIWFGQESSSLNLSTKVFGHYQAVFPWLQNSLDLTLNHPMCPFDKADGVRLIKFVKSLEQRNRNISVITNARVTIGKTDTMLEIVKHSQLPETELILDVKETVLSSTGYIVRSNLLKFYQYNLACAPPSIDRKILLKSLMSKLPDDIHSLEQLTNFMNTHGPDESKLALFKFMERNPDADFINLACSSSRTGSIGWFNRPQKLIDGEWRGLGEFTGMIDGKPYKICWDKNSNPTLHVNSRTHLERMSRDLKGILKSMEVERSHSRTPGASCYFDTRRQVVTDVQSNFGLAVIEAKISSEIIGDSEYEIEVKQSADIVLNLKNSNRKIQMMKLKPRGDYIVRAPLDEEKLSFADLGISEVDYCWVSSKSLPLKKCYELIDSADYDMRAWCAHTLRQRLDHHNLRALSIVKPMIEEDARSEASDDLSAIDFDFEDLLKQYDQVAEELEIDKMNKIHDDFEKFDTSGILSAFEEEDVLVEDFVASSAPISGFNPEKRNKFWDNYIAKMKEISSPMLIQRILSNNPAAWPNEDDLNRHMGRLHDLMRSVE